MIDVQRDYMYQFIPRNETQTQEVDSVRLIKTNREFYVKLLTLYFKFWEGNLAEF